MTLSRSNAVRWGALAIGVLLFAAALYYVNVPLAVEAIERLGVALPLALIASGLWHLARTWAWSWCFPPTSRIGFLRLARVRLAAEAFSYLTLRGIAGEPLKVVLLNDRVDPREATAAVALERLAYMVGTTIIVGIGSVIALVALPLTPAWFRVFRAFAMGAAVIGILCGIVISGRGAYVHLLFAAWDRQFGTTIGSGRVPRFISAVERQMLDLVRGNPRRLAVLLTATIVSYALMAIEAWVILEASGTPASAVGALAVETFSRVASFGSAFIPANLGALEASSLAAAAAAGLAGGGAALAVARRIRGLFWAGVGLAIYPRGVKAGLPAEAGSYGVPPEGGNYRVPAEAGNYTGPGHGATLLYVLRDSRVKVSPHVRLAGLPLSERILRAAFKAGAGRVIVWDRSTRNSQGPTPNGRKEERGFERTVRGFGDRVVIVRDPDEWRAIVEPLGSVAAIGPGTLVSPALLAEACDEHVSDPGTVRDVAAGDGWPVSGVVRLPGTDAANLPALANVLHARTRMGSRPTGDDVAHGRARLAVRMLTARDVPSAEQHLRRSSYKDTDAKVARFNRRISLPISVALIRTPLTANQLSVILVGVGLYAGWLFGTGHYVAGVLGAFLSLASSILDGCDGEIARLKYQESALGCWIETFGDYSYYIAIFIGLTIGAVRQTGMELFYWIGGAALAGTLVTFALLIYLRARITNGQPTRLHAVARARFKAEPTFWSRIIWRVSFVATRAAMPYGIMLLALVNLLPAVVVLAAIGGNVYWMSLVAKFRLLFAPPSPAAS
jgi:phosphatidylglycerophosphate synthase